MKRGKSHGEDRVNLQGLQNQLSDIKLLIALLAAAQQDDETETTRLDTLAPDAPERIEEVAFIARTQEKTLGLIRRETHKLLRTERLHGMQKIMRIAAVLVLISFLSLGTAMAVSPGLRVQVMRLLFRVTPQYTEISYVPDEKASFEVPQEWTGNYYPAYIPDEYSFYGIAGTGSMRDAVYVAQDNKILRFSENDQSVEANIDTEGYAVREIEIHGQSALLATKEGKSKIVWSEADRYFILTVTEDAETAIKIAQRVTIIK